MKDERFERLCKHRSMYTLRRFSKLFQRWTLYEDRISDLSKTFDRWKLRTQESPRELVCQSEAKRKQAPQSEASVCQQWKCNLKKKRPLLIAQDTQHKLGVAFEVRERNYRLKGIHVNIEMQITRFLKVLSQMLLFQQKRLYNSPWVFFLKMNLFLIRGINRR